MWIARTIDQARTQRRQLAGRVALVPTMGALHAGHVSLIEAAAKLADHVVVSIFVNPTQFGPGEDFDRYPRPHEQDLAMCQQAGAAGAFCPATPEMYPQGAPECRIDVPALTEMLEGQMRPGHFAGVCQIVAKLFNIVQPNVACFGRKDYQQLKVIEAMSASLSLPIQIVGLATVRDDDGLALSSRNAYLDPSQRQRALALSKALRTAGMLVEQQGESDPRAVEQAMQQVLAVHHVEVDYAVVRHPHTLAPLDCLEPALSGGVIALVAARVDGVRLIDNMLLGEPQQNPSRT